MLCDLGADFDLTDNQGNTSIQLGATHDFGPLWPNSGMAVYSFPSFAGGSGDAFTAPMPAADHGAARACNDRGVALAREGQWDEAAAQFQQALRHWPDFALAQCNLGSVYLTQGRPAASVEQVNVIIHRQRKVEPVRSLYRNLAG